MASFDLGFQVGYGGLGGIIELSRIQTAQGVGGEIAEAPMAPVYVL